MTLPSAPTPPAAIGTRFFLVGYLPTYIALLYLLVLAWAVRGPGTSFTRAWRTATQLTAAQIVFVALLVLIIAVLLTPFQLGLVRVLEGAWPDRLGGDWSLERQRDRRKRLLAAAEPKSDDPAEMWRAGTAGLRLRTRYPLAEHLVRATRLGNILAAMEDRAGRDYGLDAVVAWPRLYPLLSAATKAIVDDRRTTLDMTARLSGTSFVAAIASAAILYDARWWLLLVLAPLVVAVVAYLGALPAALAYSESVQAAFDLHHLALGPAFGLARPKDSADERVANRQLCDLWRQSIPHPFTYAAAEPAKQPSGGATA
ncbi:hypothetical protein [Dactylosporangium sp. NPDC051541]|uniref:hypothetical protein n=1 Tax=Dactylosporangium sp. NPDC051541 TaxID=3363977 RepID=UPI0037AEE9DB